MNLGEMRTEVRDIVGEETGDFWTDAELNRHLNEAQHRFLEEERWPWLVTEGTGALTADDPDLELTEGVAATRHVSITLTKSGDARFYQPIRVTSAKGFEMRARYSSNTSSSYPEWFYVTSVADDEDDGAYITIVRFIPTPNSDMDVEYQYFRPTVLMDADNSTPDVPVQYHKALVHFAAGTAWVKELNGESKAREQFELYAGVVGQAQAEWQTEPDDTPLVAGKSEPQRDPYVRGGFDYGDDPWLARMPETLGP